MAALISLFAQRGRMLFRSHAELYEAVHNFQVAEQDGSIMGVCAWRWSGRIWRRSVPWPLIRRRRAAGIGQALVQAVIEEARRLRRSIGCSP